MVRSGMLRALGNESEPEPPTGEGDVAAERTDCERLRGGTGPPLPGTAWVDSGEGEGEGEPMLRGGREGVFALMAIGVRRGLYGRLALRWCSTGPRPSLLGLPPSSTRGLMRPTDGCRAVSCSVCATEALSAGGGGGGVAWLFSAPSVPPVVGVEGSERDDGWYVGEVEGRGGPAVGERDR